MIIFVHPAISSQHIKATSRQSNNENKDPIVLSDSSDEENSLHRHEETAFSSNLRRENLLLQEMLNTKIQEVQEVKSSKRLIEDSLQSSLSNHKKQEKCIEELNAELKEAKVAISKSEEATENALREITVLSETTEKLQATVDQLSVELCSSKEETIEAKHTATESMEALARANSEKDKATSEIASLRRKLSELTEELEASKNAASKAESRAFELYDKHTKLQKTTAKVTKERDELKVALDREKALNDALASKVTTTDEPKECTEGSRANTVSSDPDSVARVFLSNTVQGDDPKHCNVDMDHHQGQKKKKD
jgi:chromosome segregation ATPase